MRQACLLRLGGCTQQHRRWGGVFAPRVWREWRRLDNHFIASSFVWGQVKMRRDYEQKVLYSDGNERCLRCRKSSGEEEEGDPCKSQADVHIYGGRYLYEHLQKKLPSHHQPASQTAFVFLWGGQPPDLGEELAWFPLKTEGEEQWPCLLISLSSLKEKDSACACLFSPRLKVEDSDHALLCIVKMLNQQNRPHTPQHMSFLQEKVSLKVSTKHVWISKDLTKRPNRLYTFSMSFLISRVLYIQLCIEQFLWILHMWMMIMAGGSSIDTSPKIGGG